MNVAVILIFAKFLCGCVLSAIVETQQLSHGRIIRQTPNSRNTKTQVTEMNIAFDLPDITTTIPLLSGYVQLEGFKSVNNDKIIAGTNAGTNTSQLFWVSIGHPHFIKRKDSKNSGEMKFFHSSSTGFYTEVQMMTDEQRTALAIAAHNKYQVNIADRQVKHLILAKFYCNILLYDEAGNRYLLGGNISDFRQFPLRMDFDIPPGKIERNLFSKSITEPETDLQFECHIESSGGKLIKSNTLSISYEQSQQIGLEEKLFGPAGNNATNEIYVTRIQMSIFAQEMYLTFNIIEEYRMPETQFSEAFVSDFISQLASSQFNQVPIDTALASISKYSLDFGADLRPDIIKKDIGSFLSVNKTDENSRIIFDEKRYNDWANSKKISGSVDLGLSDLFKVSIKAAVDISNRGTTNDQTLSDQMRELNTLSQKEAQWEIEGEKIVPKSLNVARIIRSNMKTSLTFKRIRFQQFHAPFERNFKLCTSRSSQFQCQYVSTPKVCPYGFDYVLEIDQCLKLVLQPKNWNNSRDACNSIMPGVKLATIANAVKQAAVQRYLEIRFNSSETNVCAKPTTIEKVAWTSGQTKDPTKCGTPFMWKPSPGEEIPFNYTKWLSGEPNCAQSVERCANIWTQGNYTWNDSDCSILFCSLCEF